MVEITNFVVSPKYQTNNRSKHHLKFHLIFACKYRKKLLVDQLDDDIKEIFQSISDCSDFDIDVMESDIDHIHFLISYVPSLSVAQIVRRMKQESTRRIWLLYPISLRRSFWYKKIFWSDGYFACSIGEASVDTIHEYILSQG